MGALLLKALISRYTAQKDEALAGLTLYLNNPSAVPDHPGIVDELDRLIQKLSAAEGFLQTLEQNVQRSGAPPLENE